MDDELVQVFSGPPNQAEFMRSVLESNGISVVIRGSGMSGSYAFTVGEMAETTLLVPASDAEVARQLLRPDESRSPTRSVSEGVPSTYAFRRSVMRWLAAIVLLVTVISVLTSLDLW